MKRQTIPLLPMVSKDTHDLVKELAFVTKVVRLLKPLYEGHGTTDTAHALNAIEAQQRALQSDLCLQLGSVIPMHRNRYGALEIVLRRNQMSVERIKVPESESY